MALVALILFIIAAILIAKWIFALAIVAGLGFIVNIIDYITTKLL